MYSRCPHKGQSGGASLIPRCTLAKTRHELPRATELVRQFATEVDQVVLVEEVEPILETKLKAAGIQHSRRLRASRSLTLVRPVGIAMVNSLRQAPPVVSSGLYDYPEDPIAEMEQANIKIYAFDVF